MSVSRTRQIESINEQALRRDLAYREAELQRQQAEERARLASQLERTNRALKESNEQLNQFASIASHDLQAPLRRVISFCQLLQKKSKSQLDKEAVEFIGYIVKSTQDVQQLVSDLLTYSRVNTHEKPLDPTDCAAVLDEVLSNLELPIRESGATVNRAELPTLPAYRSQLVQVFQNLIANAIHYRSDQAPRIDVAAEAEDSAWQFSVRDNGIGIESKYLEKIFMMFKRLHGEGERSGTGIGLAICQRIVERHGGRIWVESVPGRGSVFYFTVLMCAEKETTTLRPEESTASAPPVVHKGEKRLPIQGVSAPSAKSVARHESPPFNKEEALKKVGGSEGTLREMVDLFADESVNQMHQIRHARAAGDYDALKRAAHTLKSSVSIFAAQNAFDAALRIEMIAGDGELGEFDAAWTELQEEMGRLMPALDGLLPSDRTCSRPGGRD